MMMFAIEGVKKLVDSYLLKFIDHFFDNLFRFL